MIHISFLCVCFSFPKRESTSPSFSLKKNDARGQVSQRHPADARIRFSDYRAPARVKSPWRDLLLEARKIVNGRRLPLTVRGLTSGLRPRAGKITRRYFQGALRLFVSPYRKAISAIECGIEIKTLFPPLPAKTACHVSCFLFTPAGNAPSLCGSAITKQKTHSRPVTRRANPAAFFLLTVEKATGHAARQASRIPICH